MQWDSISPVLALWALIVATIATWHSRRAMRTATSVSAGLARLSGELSELRDLQRAHPPLTSSQLAELAEVRDAIEKGNALLKRINQRETMRDRRESSGRPSVDSITDKDQLRRIAGLRAGTPAPHIEGRA